jgi:hypothetical protein
VRRATAPADRAGRLLARAVRLLPDGQQDWGVVMRAELAALGPGRARWRFALGCARVAATRPAAIRAGVNTLLVAAAAALGVSLALGIADARLRAETVALLALLVAACWAGRRFAPIAGRAAGTVRAGGYTLIGAFAVLLTNSFRLWPQQDTHDSVSTAMPIYTVVVAVYMLALLAATRSRWPLDGQALATATGTGALGALAWLVIVLIRPPVPTDSAGAVVLVIATASLAAALTGGRTQQRLPAALSAGAGAALLIVVLANGLLQLAHHWVPDTLSRMAPPDMTAAQRLSANENQAQDPYIGVMFLGLLLAMALILTIAAARRQDRP